MKNELSSPPKSLAPYSHATTANNCLCTLENWYPFKYKIYSVLHIVLTFCTSAYRFAIVCFDTIYTLLNGCIKIYLTTLLLDKRMKRQYLMPEINF